MADLTKLYHLEQYPDSYESLCEWARYRGQGEVVGALGQSVSLSSSQSVLFPQQSLLWLTWYTTCFPGPLLSLLTPKLSQQQPRPQCS